MSSQLRLGSVLIPAHNEASVIKRCLDHLFDGIAPDELEVVVVCNGCSDDTAAIAKSSGHRIEVVELDEPSKPAALRRGDATLRTFPRLYLDADVVLPGRVARRVLHHLALDGAIAARPPFRYETSHSSTLVRRYYKARVQTPAVMGALWGAGVYGLSAAGRARFGEFPDVVADDLFVDQHIARHEIALVGNEPVTIVAPARTGDLLKVMRRAYRGAAENRTGNLVEKAPATATSTMRDVVQLATTGFPGAIDALTYTLIAVSARVYAAWGSSTRWERDDSSRAGHFEPPV